MIEKLMILLAGTGVLFGYGDDAAKHIKNTITHTQSVVDNYQKKINENFERTEKIKKIIEDQFNSNK